MEPDEIRAEIELRKKRAIDLKIRETLWSLYQKTLWSLYYRYKHKPPAEANARITIGPTVYDLICKEGPPSSSIHPIQEVEDVHILATLALSVDNQPVFECEINIRTLWLSDGPLTTSDVGTVTRFIEGPWVSELTELKAKHDSEQKALYLEKEKSELNAMKDRFGL